MKRFIYVAITVAACGPGMNAGQDGANGDDGTGGDGPHAPTETKVGTVTIESTRYTVSTTTVEQGYATGTFYRIPPITGGGGGGCTNATYGACTVQTCVAGPPSDGGLAITYTDAGPMTIHGVQVNDGTMMLTPGAYGYVTVSGAVALFNGGDTVRFVAPGNPHGAPALDVSLVAPGTVQVTAPTFDQGHVTASASSDLHVAWTGSSAVTTQLAAGSSGQSAIAHCAFTGGGGVVPAAALAAVRMVGGSASIMVMSENRMVQSPDGWSLTFSLQSYGILPSGLAAGTLTIQ